MPKPINNDSVSEEDLDSSLGNTIKLKLPKPVNIDSVSEVEKPNIDKTLKLGINKTVNSEVNKPDEHKSTPISKIDSNSSEEKSSGVLAKTLKLKLRGKSATGEVSSINTDAKKTIFKNTLKLKSSLGKTPSQQTSSITAKTISLNRKQTTADAISSGINPEKTIKLKTPGVKKGLSDSNSFTKTLRLKKDLPGLNNLKTATINTVKITNEKVIKLRPAISNTVKLDPLATQTIKIKPIAVSASETIKIPAVVPDFATKTVKISPAISETVKIPATTSATVKIPVKDTQITDEVPNINIPEENIEKIVDLPSVDSKATQEELNEQAMFDGLSLNADLEQNEVPKAKSKKESKVPELSDLKGVLDNLKNAKKDKIQKSVEKKKGVNVSTDTKITQNKKTSFVAIAIASVTLFALVGFFYLMLTSYLTIS